MSDLISEFIMNKPFLIPLQIITVFIIGVLFSSCHLWKKPLLETKIDHQQQADAFEGTELQQPDTSSDTSEDLNISNINLVSSTKSEDQLLFMQHIKEFLSDRIELFDQFISAHLGVIVFKQVDGESIFTHNAEKCFIPASLTKIVLCSTFIRMMEKESAEEDLSLAFKRETLEMNWEHPSFRSLSYLFHQINSYTFRQAQHANQTANDLGKFIQKIFQNNTGIYENIEQIFLSHIDHISFVLPCNRIQKASGLTLNNRLSPFQVADCMYHLKDKNIYVKSLMQAGEGTLTNRLKGIGDNHYFKTGSLKKNGVACLAGYLNLSEPLGIVIMINMLSENSFLDAVYWMDENILKMVKLV